MPAQVPNKPAKPKQVGPRRDPVLRRIDDGMPAGFRVVNADPNRHYIWANRADKQCGEWKFRGLGYQVESYSPEGVSLIGGPRGEMGTPIESGSHVLMSIDMEARKEIELNGDGIGEGMRWADRMEKSMIREGGFKDTLRGQDGRVYLREKDLRTEPNAAPYGEIIEE
jgi:hypothetical protein